MFFLRIFLVADAQPHSNGVGGRLERNHLRACDDVRALIRGYACVSVNEFFGGDDAGGGHVQSGEAANVRLALANFRGVDELQAFDAVVFPAFLQRGKLGLLVRIGGNH